MEIFYTCLVGGVVGQRSWTSYFLSLLFYHTLSCINHPVCCLVLLMVYKTNVLLCPAILAKNIWDSVANASLLNRTKDGTGNITRCSFPPPSINVASRHRVRWSWFCHTQSEKLTNNSQNWRRGPKNVFILKSCPSIFGQDLLHYIKDYGLMT